MADGSLSADTNNILTEDNILLYRNNRTMKNLKKVFFLTLIIGATTFASAQPGWNWPEDEDKAKRLFINGGASISEGGGEDNVYRVGVGVEF